MTFILFRSCFGLFLPFFWSGGVKGSLLGPGGGRRHPPLGCWTEVNEGTFFFLQKHQWVKGTRDSEAPRACQWWVAMNTPKSERETGRNCVYYWSLGRARATGEEPGPWWSWGSSTEAPEQRENRRKCPSISLLPPSLSCPRLPLAEPDWKP